MKKSFNKFSGESWMVEKESIS